MAEEFADRFSELREDPITRAQADIQRTVTAAGPSDETDFASRFGIAGDVGTAQLREGAEGQDILSRQAARVGQENFPEADKSDFNVRATLSLFADTPEEQDAAIKRFFGPTAEIVRTPASPLVDDVPEFASFRLNPGEPLRPLDRPFMQSITNPTEMLLDVADLAGMVPRVAGAVMALRGGRVGPPRGPAGISGVPARAPGFGRSGLQAGAGEIGGEIVRQGMQFQEGTQRQSLEDLITQGGQVGAEGFAGGVLGRGLEGAVNTIRGVGFGSVTPEGAAAVRSASEFPGSLGSGEDEGFRMLASQVSDSPLVKRFGAQAEAIMGRMGKFASDQQRAVTRTLRRAGTDPETAGVTPTRNVRANLLTNARTVLERESGKLVDALSGLSKNVSALRAGQSIRSGRRQYERVSQGIVGQTYQAFKDTGFEPVFNITTPVGRQAAAEDGRSLVQIALDVRNGVTNIGRPTVVRGAGDVPEVVEGAAIRMNPDLDPATAGVIDDLLAIPEGNLTIDGLRGLEQRLFDAALPGPEGVRQAQAPARSLLRAIRDVMDNPTNLDPSAMGLYTNARRTAKARFDALENFSMLEVARTQAPRDLARSLARPGQADRLSVLKEFLPERNFQQLQNFFKTDLIGQADDVPGSLLGRLQEFDPETLNLLMPRSEQSAFQQFATKLSDLDSSGVRTALGQQSQQRAFFRQVIANPNTAQIGRFVDLVEASGGKTSEFGESVRAALFDELLQRSFNDGIKRFPGVGVVDGRLLSQSMREFGDKGLLRLFTPADLRLLNNTRRIQAFTGAMSDPGASIMTAGVVQELSSLSASAMLQVARYAGIGRLMVNPGFNSFMIGGGRAPNNLLGLRVAGAALEGIAGESTREALGQPGSEVAPN